MTDFREGPPGTSGCLSGGGALAEDTNEFGGCWFLVGALYVLALLVPIGQAIYWLYSGSRISMSLIDVAGWLYLFGGGEEATWLHSPGSWIGLHQVLDSLHVSILILAFAIVLMVTIESAEKEALEKAREQKRAAGRKAWEEWQQKVEEQEKLQEKMRQLELLAEKEKAARAARRAKDKAKLAKALLRLRAKNPRNYTLAEIYAKARLPFSRHGITKAEIEQAVETQQPGQSETNE